MVAMSEFALKRRALAAYWADAGATGFPSEEYCRVQPIDGLIYVVLANKHYILAVFRWLPREQLKRLRRWPEEIIKWKPK
jgi:hypothetical protein